MASVQLTAQVGKRSDTTGAYLSVALGDLARDASSVQSGFDSVQPPDKRADDLQSRVDSVLTPATSALTSAAVAARRGDLAELAAAVAPLNALAKQLRQLQQAGG